MTPPTAPAPLCGHGLSALRAHRGTAICNTCGSFWDLSAIRQSFTYDADYPAARRHFSRQVGANKVRTLSRWLRELQLDLTGKSVCEVGFGAGWCLAWLARQARCVYGIEAIPECLAHASGLGVARERLFTPDALPKQLESEVDVWLYQDSFEHLPDPDGHLAWVLANSAQRARVLLVLPCADSLSCRLLGPLWPHRLPDHAFHWSTGALEELLRRHGFPGFRTFRPMKAMSPGMVFFHATHFLGWNRLRVPELEWPRFWANVGEVGVLASKG